MKNIFKPVLMITYALLIISCGGNQSKEEKNVTDSSHTIESTNVPANVEIKQEVDDTVALKNLTKEILILLKNNQYDSLANYFHPDSGVRFSPYAFVDPKKNVKLSGAEFTKAVISNKKFTWGNADGSGDSITLTIPEYIKKFVYNADFVHAKKTSVNKMIGSGNSLNNLQEIYPAAPFTESYDAGKHEMAWSSLRLVFNKVGHKFYLIAMVHDQWTI